MTKISFKHTNQVVKKLIKRILKSNENSNLNEDVKDFFDELLAEIKQKYNDTKFTQKFLVNELASL